MAPQTSLSRSCPSLVRKRGPPGWLFSLFPSHSRTRTTRGEAAAARGTEKAPAGRSRGELRADQVINGAAACGWGRRRRRWPVRRRRRAVAAGGPGAGAVRLAAHHIHRLRLLRARPPRCVRSCIPLSRCRPAIRLVFFTTDGRRRRQRRAQSAAYCWEL